MYLSYLNNEQVTGDAKRDERVRGMEGREIFYFFNRTCNEFLVLYLMCVSFFFFFFFKLSWNFPFQ